MLVIYSICWLYILYSGIYDLNNIIIIKDFVISISNIEELLKKYQEKKVNIRDGSEKIRKEKHLLHLSLSKGSIKRSLYSVPSLGSSKTCQTLCFYSLFIHRTLMRTPRLFTSTLPKVNPNTYLRNSQNHLILDRRSAAYQINKPKPTESSHEGLTNNPAISIAKNNKPATVFQHFEVIKSLCNFPGCNGKICIGLCSKQEKNLALGHVTHSQKYGVPLSKTDLSGNNHPQNYVPYSQPHEVQNLDINDSKTKCLQDPNILSIIKSNEPQ
jgi:hypothetical protein